MKLTKSKLKQLIKEELSGIIAYNRDDSQSSAEIAIDRGVSALLEATYDFDPPQMQLDMLETKIRKLLDDPELTYMLDDITGANIKEGFMDRLSKTLTKHRSLTRRDSRKEQAETIANNTFETLQTTLNEVPDDLNEKIDMLRQMKELISRALIWGPRGDIEMSLNNLANIREEKEE